MRFLLLILPFFALQPAGFSLETRLTALTALKLLPAGAAARVAKIEGRDGDPAPERWHILVHEPAAPHGLREYVVADGAVVADREISQFAETLSAADVIGASAVQIDSDKAARELQRLASKNSVPVHAINYALQKDAAGKAPVWNVSAVDEKGEPLGTVVLSAAAGEIVSHEGFSLGAKRDSSSARTAHASSGGKKSAQKDDANAPRESASEEESVDDESKPVAKKTPSTRENSRQEVAASRRPSGRRDAPLEPVAEGPAPEVRRAAPANENEEVPRRSKVGRVLRHLLPF